MNKPVDPMKPVAALLHVPDVRVACRWYAQAFSASLVSFSGERGPSIPNVGGFRARSR